MTSSTKSQSPLRGNMPSVHVMDDVGEPIRTSPYYPGLCGCPREKILHPILMSAEGLDPIPERRELHVRLHPALANARPSVFPQDAKDLVPLPLFGSPNSRRYPRIVSSDDRSRISNNGSKESSMYTSPLLTLLTAEIDAEITALSSSSKPTVERDRPTEMAIPIEPNFHDRNGHKQNPMMLGRTDTIDKQLSATTSRIKDMQQRRERKTANAKVSISNFKELAATVASAGVQTFKSADEAPSTRPRLRRKEARAQL